MYAVINDRGKQYVARAGERLRVDLLDLEAGAPVVFDRVLLVGSGQGAARLGQPTVDGASVRGTVIGDHKDRKLIVFKKRRRKKLRRKNGHRQRYTDIRVETIQS